MTDDYIASVVLGVISTIGTGIMYVGKKLNSRLNDIDVKLDAKVELSEMHEYVNDKHANILREMDDKRDRIIALEVKIDKIMALLIEMKNGQK